MQLSEKLAAALQKYQEGNYVESEQLSNEILEADQNNVRALNLLGMSLHEQGLSNKAISALEKAIEINPEYFSAHNNKAIVYYEKGFHDLALRSADQAISLRPDASDFYVIKAQILYALGQYENSIACVEKSISLDPAEPRAYSCLGAALSKLDRNAEALTNYSRAIALGLGDADTHNNRGVTLRHLGRYQEALADFDKAITISSGYAGAFINRGNVLRDLKRYEESLSAYNKALTLQTDLAEAWLGRGHTLFEFQCYDDALAAYNEALAIDPNNARAYSCLGNLLFLLGRVEEAMAHCEKALAIKPNDADAHNDLGTILRARGRLDEAIQAFEKAIALAPRRPDFYLNLAGSRRITASDPHFAAILELTRDMASLVVEDRISLHFTLGKVFADLGDQQRSFRHLLEGNSLKRQQITYDEAKTLKRFERTQAIFTAELMRDKQGLGDPSRVPVFIVGMPRSGTTLVEQILASHPKVFGAGELREFGNLTASISGPNGSSIPEAVTTMSGEQLRELGASYLRSVQGRAPEAERITDKMPVNFGLAGLIHLALPNARIIHVRRDPCDTALSCFSLLFTKNQLEFTYDLAELGRYIRAYQALMEHWRTVLPEGTMLEVQYEEVVGNIEEQARRIIAYCGLEWDEACLAFHKTERPVTTASVTQVRQPIYGSSVGRWRSYEDQLQPLLQALEQS
jgi:tetratricopeptide (TPR) repeat protein